MSDVLDIRILTLLENAAAAPEGSTVLVHPLIPEAIAEIERLTREYAQLKEAYDTVSAGKPLGPVVGAQTILNQNEEIVRLTRERDEAREDNARLRAAIEEATHDLENQPQFAGAMSSAERLLRRAQEKNDD